MVGSGGAGGPHTTNQPIPLEQPTRQPTGPSVRSRPGRGAGPGRAHRADTTRVPRGPARHHPAHAHEAGVPFLAARDSGISSFLTHGSIWDSIAFYIDAGAPTTMALAATIPAAADACRVGDRRGRIRTGSAADLLHVGADVRADVARLATSASSSEPAPRSPAAADLATAVPRTAMEADPSVRETSPGPLPCRTSTMAPMTDRRSRPRFTSPMGVDKMTCPVLIT